MSITQGSLRFSGLLERDGREESKPKKKSADDFWKGTNHEYESARMEPANLLKRRRKQSAQE